MKVTQCKPGYAWGYAPLNGFYPLEDLAVDTANVRHPVSINHIATTRKASVSCLEKRLAYT
jgi:hypothetical protein